MYDARAPVFRTCMLVIALVDPHFFVLTLSFDIARILYERKMLRIWQIMDKIWNRCVSNCRWVSASACAVTNDVNGGSNNMRRRSK
jgi:hypothetical protein